MRGISKYWRNIIKILQFTTPGVVLTNRLHNSVPLFWVKKSAKKWVNREESWSQVSTRWDGFNRLVAKSYFKVLWSWKNVKLNSFTVLRFGGEGRKALPIFHHISKSGGFSVNPSTIERVEFVQTCNSTVAIFSPLVLTHINPQLCHRTMQHSDPIPNGCLQL